MRTRGKAARRSARVGRRAKRAPGVPASRGFTPRTRHPPRIISFQLGNHEPRFTLTFIITGIIAYIDQT